MNVTEWVSEYGYWAVFAGALSEGETLLLAAGFAAHRGMLDPLVVMLVAFVGGTLGDQIWFFVGRWRGAALLARWPRLQAGADRVKPLLDRHPNAAVLGIRFVYGLRTAGPIAMGTLGLAPWRFVVLNLIGAAVWAVAVTGIGWLFGNTMQWLFDDLREAEDALLLAIVFAGLAYGVVRWRRHA